MIDVGIKFNNPALLEQAFTHRSYLNENDKVKQSNERLEFLGDSVLQVLSSTELFKRFPKLPEGKLTNLRSALVRTVTIGKVAQKLNFGQLLLISKGEEAGGGRENLSILADTFEAVLGAIYLDQGILTAKEFLNKHLFPLISGLQNEASLYDFKSKLQEVVQKDHKSAPVYKIISQKGPDHDKVFVIAVLCGKTKLGEGSGKSKQEAEQQAARVALEELKV
jgi:ribonuclease-3